MKNKKEFSIVIPTMWMSEYLLKMLPIYQECDKIKEIIIIDNEPKNKYDVEKFTKVIYYTENKNLFVNPSWNIGYQISKYKLILANDDIYIPNINDVLTLINQSDYDIIGLDWNKSKNLLLNEINNFPGNGFGCFMYIKNYELIPEKYKIWRGDYILFEKNKKRASLSNPQLGGEISKTVNSNKEYINQGKKDVFLFKQQTDEVKNKVLFSIVNYGLEQIEFLKKMVNEINNFKKYDVKIIINSNVNLDINGVETINIFEMDDYQLLPLTCRKTIWENKENFDLFVFSENDHLFKEYHLDKFLEYNNILPEDRIAGLIQYEENEEGKYYPAFHKNYDWDYSSVEIYGNKIFAHFKNHHQASFIITKKQLEKIGKKYDFTNFFKDSWYSLKCKVNTDIYQFCDMKKVICISEFEKNLIHHLPNLYINGDKGRNKNQRSDDKKMKESLIRLLNLTENNTKQNIKYEPTINTIKNDFLKKEIRDLIESKKNEIKYENINSRPTSNPVKETQKKIEQKKPINREEIINIKKDSIKNTVKRLLPSKPNRRLLNPNIFSGKKII